MTSSCRSLERRTCRAFALRRQAYTRTAWACCAGTCRRASRGLGHLWRSLVWRSIVAVRVVVPQWHASRGRSAIQRSAPGHASSMPVRAAAGRSGAAAAARCRTSGGAAAACRAGCTGRRRARLWRQGSARRGVIRSTIAHGGLARARGRAFLAVRAAGIVRGPIVAACHESEAQSRKEHCHLQSNHLLTFCLSPRARTESRQANDCIRRAPPPGPIVASYPSQRLLDGLNESVSVRPKEVGFSA